MISGHRVISSLLVGGDCEFSIIWSKFDPCGARFSGSDYLIGLVLQRE